jgi:glycosyltransferase involved in cell wall biosynthesis
MKPLGFRLIGPYKDISGIASNLREFAIALSETGVPVSLVDVQNVSPFKATIDEITAKRLEVMAQTSPGESYVSIYMLPPELVRLHDNKAKANIFWTACETDKVPYVASLMMNSPNVTEVWAATNSSLNSFKMGGVNPDKLKLVSWGVDSVNFQPGNPSIASLKEEGNFYFSYIGSLKTSAGFDVVLKAFYEEFKDDEKAKLLFKAFVGNVEPDKERELIRNVIGKFKGDSKAEVVYVPGNMDVTSLRSLFHTGDCFVSTPRAKAWNTGVIRSMAAGVPVITNVNTGNRAYTNHQNAILIGSSSNKIADIDWLINNPLQQEHSWWEPNLAELKSAMRKVYSKETDVEAIRTAARKEALKLDWKRIAMEVIKNVKQYGDK